MMLLPSRLTGDAQQFRRRYTVYRNEKNERAEGPKTQRPKASRPPFQKARLSLRPKRTRPRRPRPPGSLSVALAGPAILPERPAEDRQNAPLRPTFRQSSNRGLSGALRRFSDAVAAIENTTTTAVSGVAFGKMKAVCLARHKIQADIKRPRPMGGAVRARV
jgi:hypothetical protein